MIEACWCEQHDLFYWESLNSQPVTLPETDPILAHTLAAYSYCMRTNFFDNLSDRFVQGPNVSLSVQRPEWHKLLLIKFLTIHGKWVFSVNTVRVGANGACWGLLGNKASPPSESTFEESTMWKHEQLRLKGPEAALQLAELLFYRKVINASAEPRKFSFWLFSAGFHIQIRGRKDAKLRMQNIQLGIDYGLSFRDFKMPQEFN